MTDRRHHLSLTTKLASALLHMVRQDEDGKFVPVIPHTEAKTMTADEIVARFDFDHVVFHAIGGDIRPSNLTPRLRAEHRDKTAKVDIPAIAKVKRLSKSEEEFRARITARDRGEPKPTGKIPSRPWSKRQRSEA